MLFASGRSQVEHLFHRPRMRDDELHVHSLLAIVWEHVKVNSVALVEGGGFLRRQIFGRFEAEARTVACGRKSAAGKDHADTTLVVDHANAGNVSREYFKHIVDDAATGVFQARSLLRPMRKRPTA